MLARAVASVRNQTYSDWELIIINDSPSDSSYQPFASSINDPRIHYHANDTNRGINYSRNKGLNSISALSSWVIFLDDDDYLAPDALATFKDLIQKNPGESWFVTNRAIVTGRSITTAPHPDTTYSYGWNYLIRRDFQGDATHCIETSLLTKIRFSENIRQGEEWLFYYELGTRSDMYYHDHNSTITDGYSAGGLNFRKRTRKLQLKNIFIFMYEGATRGVLYRPTFIIYLCMRLVRILIKP
jgi:glycosyltransferase involved in cell wall biosynthesis